MSEEQAVPESEFDKAFSEATDEKEEVEQEAEEQQEAKQDEQADTSEEEAGEEVNWRAKAEEEAKAREAAEQKMRSWDGRLRKSSEELAKEREAREELERRLAALEHQGKEGDRKKLQKWIEDYGDDEEFSHITEVVKQQLNDADTGKEIPADEKSKPDEAEGNDMPEVDEAALAHFSAIEQKHADWHEVVGELDGWIKQLPGEKALEYSRVTREGTAQEVIAMLDDFKSRGDDKQHDTTDDADAMAAVRHRSSGRRPKGKPDKNDFDGAWDEAVSQD